MHSLTVVPGRINPRSAVLLEPVAEKVLKFVIQYHNKQHWTMPTLNAQNIVDFLHYYDHYLRIADVNYRKTIAKDK